MAAAAISFFLTTRTSVLRAVVRMARFCPLLIHNAFIDMDGEKMSKSLGNVRTVRELLARFPGEVLRFALLSAHYRSALNFSASS